MAKKSQKPQKERLFEEKLVPGKSGSGRLFDVSYGDDATKPVECLGMTFPNDEGRRAYFTDKLREKLKDPEFRRIEGFPIGEDEDILALSDPPYYTACPNQFLGDFIKHFGKPFDPSDKYHREPLAVDSSEGKSDYIFSAHSYHTKVPHKSIMRAILHYTSPGDVVLDGFAGSGMTGVAAQMCRHPEREFTTRIETECKDEGRTLPEWGVRRVVLNDLSPAATFIERGYNLPFDTSAFEKAAKSLLASIQDEHGWMYETSHTDGKTKGRINYTVWSENFACPECGREIVFTNQALDMKTKKTRDEFPCPNCATVLTNDNLQRVMQTHIDPATGDPWQRVKYTPVMVNYSVGGAKFEKSPDRRDLATLDRISRLRLPLDMPTNEFPIKEMYHGSRLAPKGFTRIHHLFFPRASQALGLMWAKCKSQPDSSLRAMLLFFAEQTSWGMSLLARYAPTHFSQVNQYLSGVYYVGSQVAECSPWYILDGKLKRLSKAMQTCRFALGNAAIATGTTAKTGLPDKCIDYIFTDPPFGENIFYADLNFLVESWHHVRTNSVSEAIVDGAKGKGLPEYQHLMQRCFEEYRRVLKPGRWMTVVFHNSKNAVWNAIQEAMLAAGFVVADVRTLDKQQGSYRQVTSSAVKQDLIISAYRPSEDLEERFKITVGSEDSAWEFVRSHLDRVPGFVPKGGRVQVIAERQPYVLYDRMVAFHVQRGYAVPLSSAEFHAGLRQRFPERDGMYFLPDQVSDYDRKRLEVKEVEQYELFVSDERSAIQWVQERIWLHWGMAALAYPFFRDTAEVVGRLLALQDDFTTAQVQGRMLTTWGDRATSKEAAQKLITTLVDWEVLRTTKTKGHFLLARKMTTSTPDLQLWLLEALLMASMSDEIEAQQLLRLPESFPFTISVGVADLRRHEGFNIHRQGLDMDMVALRRVKADPPPKPAGKRRIPKKAAKADHPTLFDMQGDEAGRQNRNRDDGHTSTQPVTSEQDQPDPLSERRRVEDSIKNEVLRTVSERADRFLQVRGTVLIPDRPFAAPAFECVEQFRDGHYFGCIALTQAVLEAVIRHVWQVKFKKKANQEGSFEKNLEALHKKKFLSDEWKSKLDEIWADRHSFHHLRPSIESDQQKLEATARSTLALLNDLEREFFGFTIRQGMVVPDHPEYWPINDGESPVFMRGGG